MLCGELRLHDLQDVRRLCDGFGVPLLHGLSGVERLSDDGVGTFDHELQHETAHLAALAVLGRAVIENGHVAGSLQQAVEIVGIDGDLVVDGGQFVGLSDAMGNERRVVDAPGNISLVAGEQQHMVEVEVARLEDAHHLNAFSRFTVEGNAGLLDDLHGQALKGCQVYRQVTALAQVLDAVDQRVCPEQRLLE